jgi:hypothetical protein
MRPTLLPWLALILASLAGACDRRVEPWTDPASEPPAPERPVRIPGLDTPAPRGMPTASAGGSPIRGVVQLAPGVSAPPGGVLFVIARSAEGGPPLAVKRLAPGPFPLSFEIGPDDVMIAGRAFAGPIALSVRLDTDGDPLTRSATELAGNAPDLLEPGASGVELILSAPGSSPGG